MTFPEFVRVCADNDDLVREFARLRGLSLEEPFIRDDVLAFFEFVKDLWARLPPEQREAPHG